MNREGAMVICAEHWPIDHTKVFNSGEATLKTVNDKNIVVRVGYAYVGPLLCDPAVPSDCEFIDPFIAGEDCALKRYCRTPGLVVAIGEIGGGDNTQNILSDGGLWASRAIQKELGVISNQRIGGCRIILVLAVAVAKSRLRLLPFVRPFYIRSFSQTRGNHLSGSMDKKSEAAEALAG